MMTNKTVGIWLPARRGSTRIDNKLAQKVGGQSVLELSVRRAQEAAAVLKAEVRVVTDCDDLELLAYRAGAEVTRVQTPCLSGTDRLAAALTDASPEIIINLQADEPLIPSEALVKVARFMQDTPTAEMATLVRPLRAAPTQVHALWRRDGRALYFSRQVLPGHHPTTGRPAQSSWGGHVGVYAYRLATLKQWSSLEQTPLEAAEGLEQLRMLEHGLDIHCVPFDSEEEWFGVDTEDDLERLRATFRPH